jgi:hypothetical protein
MTIEEHVARAIANDGVNWDNGAPFGSRKAGWIKMARAAIAAVREYGEPVNGVCNKCGYWGPVERYGLDQGRHPNCNYAASIVPPPDPDSIRESERTACEAIAREHAELTGDERVRRVSEAIVSDIAARKGNGEGK